jgi:hypothetical protein
MTDKHVLTDDNLDKIEKEAQADVKSIEEVKQELIDSDRKVENKLAGGNEDEVPLGEMGTFKKATKEEVDDVFEKLPGTLFQIHKCMFRISFINRGKGRFTAELVNEG